VILHNLGNDLAADFGDNRFAFVSVANERTSTLPCNVLMQPQ